MSESVEQLDRRRRRLLLWFVLAFTAWQVPTIIDDVMGDDGGRLWAGLIALSSVAGMLLWLVVGYRLLRTMQAIDSRPEVRAALNDERIQRLQDRSLRVGFFGLVIYLVGARLLSLLYALPVKTIADIGILVAVVVPIVAFLFREWGES